MATRFRDADPEERGHFVALGRLADMAVQIVRKLRQENPTESEESIDKEATQLLSEAQAGRKDDLNFHQDDIPDITDPDWRLLAYTGTEITAREWQTIRAPLKKLLQMRQTARLRGILENCPPPTPASVNMPVYHGPDDITGVVVGALPVFAPIWISRASPSLKSLPESFEIYSAAGQQTPPGALSGFLLDLKLVLITGQNGRILPMQYAAVAFLALRKAAPFLSCRRSSAEIVLTRRPFVKSGWMTLSQKNVKLYRTAYVNMMCRWYRDLPVAVKTFAPLKLIVDHVERHTNSFMKVAKQCEAWQAERDPGNVRLMARRAEAIVRRAAQHQHVLGIPGFVFESEAWKRVADQARPLCEKEWDKMKEPTLHLLEKDRIVGGIRVADLPDFEDDPEP
ncbi:hypothetical protein FRC00_003156 [Tulasnella sp. 408]|nr:hypothetical protein FRC00_003156 [Tulasnella sp. 408]